MVRGLNKVMLYPDKLIRARVITDKVLPNYLEIYFATSIPRQIIEKKAKSTAGQQGISGADLKKIPVMLPPLAEQRRIVAESERRLSVVQELEATVAANLARAERLRQSILKRAFEGKLVAQDASDEPAGVLLEKIRVNRPAANH
jgi:type I restriction enzyme S subunit